MHVTERLARIIIDISNDEEKPVGILNGKRIKGICTVTLRLLYLKLDEALRLMGELQRDAIHRQLYSEVEGEPVREIFPATPTHSA